MEQQKVDINLDFQPYFNQVVASNLIIALFTAKQAHPEKSDKEIIDMVMSLWGDLYRIFEEIPKKTVPEKK